MALLVAAPSQAGTETRLRANLSGEQETPDPGDPNGSGSALITLDPVAGTVCFSIDWTRIRSPFAAHIHRGRLGEPGPIKVVLFQADSPLPNTIDGVSGCVTDVNSDLIQRIINHPAAFYVNVHNRPFPDGAIRGQLALGVV